MEKQILLNNQSLTPQLVNTVKELSSNLKTIAPQNSETTQIITYVLVATAITGIFVYHYIKNQETLE